MLWNTYYSYLFFLAIKPSCFRKKTLTAMRFKHPWKWGPFRKKKAEYHRKTNGETDGYRVKIHFSADRAVAEGVKAKFENKHADMPTYIDYQLPNFVIVVGDYKSKLEAYEGLKKIKEEYPYAFIVKSKVRPTNL